MGSCPETQRLLMCWVPAGGQTPLLTLCAKILLLMTCLGFQNCLLFDYRKVQKSTNFLSGDVCHK